MLHPRRATLSLITKKLTLTVEEARTKQSERRPHAYTFCNLCGQVLFGGGSEGGLQGALLLQNGDNVADFGVLSGWKKRRKGQKSVEEL